MSLTSSDLNEIRNIIESALMKQNQEVLHPIQGELEALRNDIKDIYDMIAEIKNDLVPEDHFQKMSIEQRLLKLNTDLLAAAKQIGVSLPR